MWRCLHLTDRKQTSHHITVCHNRPLFTLPYTQTPTRHQTSQLLPLSWFFTPGGSSSTELRFTGQSAPATQLSISILTRHVTLTPVRRLVIGPRHLSDRNLVTCGATVSYTNACWSCESTQGRNCWGYFGHFRF